MPDIAIQGLGFLWTAVQLLALAKFAEVVVAYILGSLRLVDWLAAIITVGGLVLIPVWLWETSPWLMLAVPVALTGGFFMARSSVARWKTGTGPPVVGTYVFGSPPEGVVNWVKR